MCNCVRSGYVQMYVSGEWGVVYLVNPSFPVHKSTAHARPAHASPNRPGPAIPAHASPAMPAQWCKPSHVGPSNASHDTF